MRLLVSLSYLSLPCAAMTTASGRQRAISQRTNELVESNGDFYLPLDEEVLPASSLSNTQDWVPPDLDDGPLYILIEYSKNALIIKHDYDKPLYILRWNSILDPHAPEYQPEEIGLSLGGYEPLAAAGLHKQYREAIIQQDFLRIDPGRHEEVHIDLNWWFDLSRVVLSNDGPDDYSLDLIFAFRAFLWDGTPNNEVLQRSTIAKLPICRWEGGPLEIPFFSVKGDGSPSSRLEPRDRTMTGISSTSLWQRDLVKAGDNPGVSRSPTSDLEIPEPATAQSRSIVRRVSSEATECQGLRASEISRARKNSNGLAAYTREYPDENLWKEFNNGPFNVIYEVGRVYHNIEIYAPKIQGKLPKTDFSLKELCGYKSGICSGENVAAYTDRYSRIVFCDRFFSRLTPPLSKCDTPSITNLDMVDRSGIFLHELTHVFAINNKIGGIGIHDGQLTPITRTFCNNSTLITRHLQGAMVENGRGNCYGWYVHLSKPYHQNTLITPQAMHHKHSPLPAFSTRRQLQPTKRLGDLPRGITGEHSRLLRAVCICDSSQALHSRRKRTVRNGGAEDRGTAVLSLGG